MPQTLQEAKNRLDEIIRKGRADLYKPIQIAEVLNRSRLDASIDVTNLASFQNPSVHWRDEITIRFTGKRSTSSARYQHDVWNITAMPQDFLSVLDRENKRLRGAIERYIYRIYFERQQTIGHIIDYIARLPAATKKGGGLSLWHNSGLKSGTKPATTSHYVTDRPWTPF